MKKVLLVILLLAAAGGYYAYMNLGGAVKQMIENAGTAATGTKVSVGGLDISLKEMKAELGKLTVDNPKGYSGAVFKAKSIKVAVGEVTQEVVTINEIVVEGMQVNYVMGVGGSTNLDALKRNMASTNKNQSATPAAPKLVIKKLRIQKALLVADVAGLDQKVTMPEIVMTDIGTKAKPVTAAQAAGRIGDRLTNAATNAAMKNSITKPINKAVDKATKGVKGLFK